MAAPSVKLDTTAPRGASSQRNPRKVAGPIVYAMDEALLHTEIRVDADRLKREKSAW